jgi:hypothetical protein
MLHETKGKKGPYVEIVSCPYGTPHYLKDTVSAVQDIEQFTIEDSLLRQSIFLNTENLT